MSLWTRLRAPEAQETRFGVDDYLDLLNSFNFNGLGYPLDGITQTLASADPSERIGNDFASLVSSTLRSNGVVFACLAIRKAVFSAIRLQYQRVFTGRPSELWGDASLSLLERPWPGGTTQDLLTRMIQDADIAGNSYWTTDGAELVRLRPDWVEIVLEPRRINGGTVGWRRIGYLYYEGGIQAERDPVPLLASEVAHFAPDPDPLGTYRGQSWVSAVVREVQADGLMGRHKRKFFENGATPNMIIQHPPDVTPEKAKAFAEMLDREHAGVDKAYRRMHIGNGAIATVVGADLKQIDFKTVQGHGETRICMAASVPPILVGASEGLESATYSNYAQARRRFADGTMHPLWQNAAASLEQIRPAPASTFNTGAVNRLWYDASGVPFLREDEKDAAEIAFMEAQTLRQWIDSGFNPDSAKRALIAKDPGLLVHSGLYSVQLQPAGTVQVASQRVDQLEQ